MGTENTKLNFLLDLLDANHDYAYVSVVEFKSLYNDFYNRIEIIVPKIGRLCLYQNFIETPNDEQIPRFKVFYSSIDDKNHIKCIKSPVLLAKAVRIIYGIKKFCEQNPQFRITNEKSLIKKIEKNKKTFEKIYMDNIQERRHNWFDNFYER